MEPLESLSTDRSTRPLPGRDSSPPSPSIALEKGMSAGIFNVPTPTNEPILSYAPGSAERGRLQAALKARESEVIDIPAGGSMRCR